MLDYGRRRPAGSLRAVVEHATVIGLWNMVGTGEPYAEPGSDFFSRLNPDKAKNRAVDQLRKMGYDVKLDL
jgi:transposase